MARGVPFIQRRGRRAAELGVVFVSTVASCGRASSLRFSSKSTRRPWTPACVAATRRAFAVGGAQHGLFKLYVDADQLACISFCRALSSASVLPSSCFTTSSSTLA